MRSMPKCRQRQHDGLGVEHVARHGSVDGLEIASEGPESADLNRPASNNTVTCVGVDTRPARRGRELVQEALGVLDDTDDTTRVTPSLCQVLPILMSKADATPPVTATSSAPVG